MPGDALIATLALGGLCVVMWWLARLARKRMGIGAGTVSASGLRVVGKRPLDQKSALYVVEIAGGRHILLGSSMDGSVTKLDDISPEEFAVMTADDPGTPAAKLRLRVAGRPAADDADPTDEANGADDDSQRFATVGESFSQLFSKAKDARATRRDRRASGE